MAKLKQTFIMSRMNLDVDERLLQKGEYRRANNIKVRNPDSGDQGSGSKPHGTKKLTDIDLGINPVSLGIAKSESLNSIFWAVTSNDGDYLIEWDADQQMAFFVLKDTRNPSVLNFSKDHRVEIKLLEDVDNEETILILNDNYNPPRYVNLQRSKALPENGFSEDDISLIVKPPMYRPTINLLSVDGGENNIEDKFIRFAYRFVYEDDRYSVLSPFSEVAFEPKSFRFNYETATNESMVNKYNAVDVTFKSGDSRVKEIQLIYKESNKANAYIVDTYNKKALGISDNSEHTVRFSNNKLYQELDPKQLTRYYDDVPLKAGASAVMNNRVVLGDCVTGYDLTDSDGNEVVPDFTMDVIEESTPSESNPLLTFKSNRDIEGAIIYYDDYGRATPPLTSSNNTVQLKNARAKNQSVLTMNISHKAPSWAKFWRVALKQPTQSFDNIVPTIFYQDGVYLWVKLEGDDIDKVQKGDFLTVKADTRGVIEKDEVVKVKVLDVKTQERNFLDPSITNVTNELPGVYMKIKPDNFRMSPGDFEQYFFEGYDSSKDKHENVIQGTAYDEVADPIFYGDIDSLDDLSLGASTSYSGSGDVRYKIEIDGEGSPDTFSWYKTTNDGTTTGATGVSITAGEQLLDDGIYIDFGATTGHTSGDYWTISVYDNVSGLGLDESSNTYAVYKGLDTDVIESGAKITILYDEYNKGDEFVQKVFTTSGSYKNIEEWFYEEGIGAQLGIPDSRIWFRRGSVAEREGATYFTYDNTQTSGEYDHPMSMIIKSRSGQTNEFSGKRVEVEFSIEIFQSSNKIVFEKPAEDKQLDVFFEYGETFTVDTNGFHVTNDQVQTSSVDGIVKIRSGDCFTWGNGFESMKIRDSFTGNEYGMDTRALISVSGYGQKRRIASLIYSEPYDQQLSFNGLNEFNLSRLNWKDMEDGVRYGPIQLLVPRDTNLLVFQEDKTHIVLVNKDILYNADGSENVRQINQFLGSSKALSYEGGISKDKWSFAQHGNNIWHTDSFRGNVLRLGADGYTEISELGMSDFFRDLLQNNKDAVKLGAHDPYNDQYVLHVKDQPPAPGPEVGCGYAMIRYKQQDPYSYSFKLNEFGGDVVLSVTTDASITVEAEFNGSTYSKVIQSGSGTLTFTRDSLTEDTVSVTITPSTTASFTIINTCPVGIDTRVIQYVLCDNADDGTYMFHSYTINGQQIRVNPRYDLLDGTTGTGPAIDRTDKQEKNTVPKDGDTITMFSQKSSLTTGEFKPEVGNRLGYYVSEDFITLSGATENLLPLATFPSVTVKNDGQSNEQHSINFTFNKPTDDSILYLIWDYRDYTIDAVDDDYICVKGQSITLYPLENDTVSGDYEISAVSTPTNGTAVISADKKSIVYTHDDSATTSDSFTYTVRNEENQRFGSGSIDTATISMSVKTLTELKNTGGGGGTSVEFAMTETGDLDSQNACQITPATYNRYHDGDTEFPEVGDKVYTENTLSTAFNGQNLWYKMANGRAIYIETNGRVAYITDCITTA